MEENKNPFIYYIAAFAIFVGIIMAGMVPCYGLDASLASSAIIELGFVGIMFLIIYLIYDKLISKFSIGENFLLFLGLVSLLLNIYMFKDYIIQATTLKQNGYIILNASSLITVILLLIVIRNIITKSRK